MKRFAIVLVFMACIFILVGCNRIKEYEGTPISKIVYERIDYNGGYTNTYIFDFESNVASKRGYLPGESDENQFEVFANFTDEEEKAFFNKIYTYGLLGIKSKYKTLDRIIDGGGWNLSIEFEDGSTKKSTGENAGPTKIFKECAMAFYDLCEEGVVGSVPSNYYSPPSVSISFQTNYSNHTFSHNLWSDERLINYQWNGFKSQDNDLFAIASNLNPSPKFLERDTYTVTLYTANYGDNERFKKLELISYDLNEQLSNKKVVLSKKWFKQVDLPLMLNKIYVVKLTFKDGDYAEYAFNTKALDQNVLYGEYQFSQYKQGHCSLTLKSDQTFVLSPFQYFDSYLNQSGKVVDHSIPELKGSYGFETMSGKDYLVLYANETEKIVLDYCSRALFLDFDKTTFDVSRYNLNRNSTYNNGQVTFDYRG